LLLGAESRLRRGVNKISALNSVKVSTLDQIQLLQSACMERLMAIAEMQAPNAAMRNIVEGQKNKDTATIIKLIRNCFWGLNHACAGGLTRRIAPGPQ